MENDEEGLTLCTARPEFAALSEDEVLKAVANDNYGESPITAEVTRLGAEFLARFKAHVDEHGSVAPRALHVEARCPIERVAILTVARYVEVQRSGVRSAALH